MKQQLPELNLIRAGAAISVIGIHVSGRYVHASRAAFLWNQSMRYAVPLFIILSGFLLFHSDKYKDNVNYFSFLGRRIKKVFIPYLIWTFIYVLYNSRHNISEVWPINSKWVAGLFRHIFMGTGAFHLYFIVIILQLYLVYPLVRSLVLKMTCFSLCMSFILTFCFQSGIYMGQLKIIRLPGTPFPYFMMFPAWIFYFVFGMFVSVRIDKCSQWLSQFVWVFGLLWGISLCVLISDSIITKTSESSVKPSVMLYSISSFIFFLLTAQKFKESNSILIRLIEWISRQSYGVYLSHVLILSLLISAARRVGLSSLLEGRSGMILLFIAETMATFAFSYILSFIPFATVFGGATPGKNIINTINTNKREVTN